MPGADDLSLPDRLPRATASPEEGSGEPHQVDHCPAGQQQEGEGHLYINDPLRVGDCCQATYKVIKFSSKLSP